MAKNTKAKIKLLLLFYSFGAHKKWCCISQQAEFRYKSFPIFCTETVDILLSQKVNLICAAATLSTTNITVQQTSHVQHVAAM